MPAVGLSRQTSDWPGARPGTSPRTSSETALADQSAVVDAPGAGSMVRGHRRRFLFLCGRFEGRFSPRPSEGRPLAFTLAAPS
jgi:hypothetical protein